MKKKRRPRLSDVAQRAGVSEATVSVVLNDRVGESVRVSQETQDRIWAIARELGYVADPVARSLARGQIDTLALVVRDITNPFFAEVALAVQQEAERFGYSVLLYNTAAPGGVDDPHREANFLTLAQRWPIAGLIICQDVALENEALRSFRQRHTPVVMISPLLHELIDAVFIDDEKAAFDAVSYLIEKGHRRIAHIGGPKKLLTGLARYKGYLEALRANQLPVDEGLIVLSDFTVKGAEQSMAELITRADPPTAVFAANDVMAFGALRTALGAGLSVPDDIAIMGFDNIQALMCPGLTTVDHAQEKMGRTAVQLLMERLSGDAPEEQRVVVVPHRIVVRDTA